MHPNTIPLFKKDDFSHLPKRGGKYESIKKIETSKREGALQREISRYEHELSIARSRYSELCDCISSHDGGGCDC